MDTSTLVAPQEVARHAATDSTPHDAPRTTPHDTPHATPHSAPRAGGLGAELRESLLLLGFAVGATVGLTTAAQAALALLG